MKRYLILILAAAATLVSCNKEPQEPGTGVSGTGNAPITFDLTANHPDDTKAMKSAWEAGDAIFVFFSGAVAPKHLKMTFDGTSWTSAEYDGATLSAGDLGLKNGDTGTMRAVFLPFGSDATVSADGSSFTFSPTYYAYYLTATRAYTVADNKVSGAFNMVIPGGYVQFFIEDAAATDGAYTLGTDAVIPTGVVAVDNHGNIVETSDKVAGNDMPGYAYSGGYLFSGKLNTDYHSYRMNGAVTVEANAYYFAKKKVADNTRADYFVSGKTIASHSAVKLPANDNVYEAKNGSPNSGKWVPVGSSSTVSLYDVTGGGEAVSLLGKWYTCNYGQTVPESLGSLYTFDAANALDDVTLPTKEQFQKINNDNYCSYVWLTVHGQQGVVIKAARGFLFLPAQSGSDGYYWSSTGHVDDHAEYFNFRSSGGHNIDFGGRANEYAVRPILN